MGLSNTLSVISKRAHIRVCHNITANALYRHMKALAHLPWRAGIDQSSNRALPVHQLRSCPDPFFLPRRCYMSKTNVELDIEQLPGMERMQPYLRSCLNKDADRLNGLKGLDMEFAVAFIGTASGAATMHRNGSCTALRLGGQTFLFDVSEGTLRQLEYTAITPSSITKIFISHLHGDHVFGLVPIILNIMVTHKTLRMNPQRRQKHMQNHGEKASLEIYGPPGLYNYISMVLVLSCSKVNYLDINVIELVGGREEQGPSRPRHNRSRNAFLSHYPEIETPVIRRKYLQQNEDNVWIIDEPEPVTAQSAENGAQFTHKDGFHRLPNDFNMGLGRRLHIKAAELDHLAGVQTFGYTVEEQPPPGNIDPEKAKSLGIRPGKKYGLLKCGLSVPTDDGTGEVHPEEVLIKSYRPRKFALLADHRRVPKQMAQLCKNADLLVHEATLSKEDGLDKIKMRGHSTPYRAGLIGRELRCKVVALNHFASPGVGRDHVHCRVLEALEGNEHASQIIASYDFMEVLIPRGGFDFD